MEHPELKNLFLVIYRDSPKPMETTEEKKEVKKEVKEDKKSDSDDR